MDAPVLVLLILGGVAAGFVNTLAGGGSFLTLPLLVFAGLDASVANGTNRVAVLLQSLVASWAFGRRGLLPGARQTAALVLPALAGAALGAWLAIEIPEPVLRGLIGAVLLAAIPVVLHPEGGSGRDAVVPPRAPRRCGAGLALLLFLCGFYGGFLQAGVGFLLLATLVPIGGLDLVRANAVKVLLIALYTVTALPLFVASGQVHLLAGLLLGAGNMIGAHIGARLAVRAGARVIRWVLVAALAVAAAALLDLPRRL